MDAKDQTHADDVAAIAAIEAVPNILQIICRTTGMGFAAVARVTDERWVACAVQDDIAFGLTPGGELGIGTTICNEVRRDEHLVVIDHVAEDPAYCGHPTPTMYGFQSYISVPIFRTDRRFFGTLCAIDPSPRRLNTPEIVNMLTLFADLIGLHLDTQDRLAASQLALARERAHGELRDQFIAVLGHDLRNPLAAIQTAGKLLSLTSNTEGGARAASVVQSSAARMAALVENLLDFARVQLAGGFPMTREPVTDLDRTIDQVVAELRTAWDGRAIEVNVDLPQPVECDRARIAQLLSNLVANALAHGAADCPVHVRARSDSTTFELSVTNSGEPIAPEIADRLFQPLFRAGTHKGGQGLGLGLYIASEIARAHGGALEVTSLPGSTQFTFRVPVSNP